MSHEVTPGAILARLGALARWPSAKPPAGVRDAIRAAGLVIAQAGANVRLLEADLRESTEAESEWRDRAREAVDRAADRRADGAASEAQRLDELSRVALRRQHAYQAAADIARDAIAAQTLTIAELRDGQQTLRERWGRLPVQPATKREAPRR